MAPQNAAHVQTVQGLMATKQIAARFFLGHAMTGRGADTAAGKGWSHRDPRAARCLVLGP